MRVSTEPSHCPTCQAPAGDAQFCPRDGTPLRETAPRDPLAGRVLGERYQLTEFLGQGGMGRVYRAVHLLMDKPLAVKVLRADVAGNPEAVLRFHREARSASRLDHEHCIRVTDFGQSDDGLLYLVMELLDGETLGSALRNEPLTPRCAASIAHQSALALAHAHEHGVIHRDLKPDNIYLVRRRDRLHVKVLDFGLAKLALDDACTRKLTRTGVIYGTPDYMSPEQALGQPLDPRSDIYALGAILYQLLAGAPPFEASSVLLVLSRHVKELPVPPRLRAPSRTIPAELEAIVMRCLEKNRDARYPSAEAVAAAIARWLRADSDGLVAELTAAAAPAATRPVARSLEVAERSAPDRRVVAATPVADTTVAEADADNATLDRLPRHPVLRWVFLALLGLSLFVLAVRAVASRLPHPRASQADPKNEPATTARSDDVPSDREALGRARQLMAQNDFASATRIAQDLRRHGDSAPLQLLLGELAQRRGNRLQALAHVHLATRLAPESAEPHLELARLLLAAGQQQAACTAVQKALARAPVDATARLLREAAQCH